MKREEDEKLWDLLGRAAKPEVSPFFARNVLRQIRVQPHWLLATRRWFRPERLIPVSALAAVLVAATLINSGSALRQQPAPAYNSDPVAQVDPKDYEVVVDLDELLASDENGLWDDNSSL
jgi:hypothetical protein